MKREITPSSAAGRGGRSLLGVAFVMACAGGPSGCGSATPQVPPAVEHAMIDAIQRGANEIEEQHKPARYMNLMVVSRHGGEGVVRTVRAYPDGRVDAAPWAAWARMSP